MKLKKILFVTTCAGAFVLASCGGSNSADTSTVTTTEVAVKAMTYKEYVAAADGAEVTIDAYIQDRCTWYNNAASFYLAGVEDGELAGGYYVYNLACTEEEYATLTKGVHLQITGAKSTWKGEAEINYGTATDNQGWKIVDEETSEYDAVLVPDVSTAALDKHKNEKVAVKELTVVGDAKYNWDGSGEAKAGTDIYFDVTDGTNTQTFVVESYLEETQYGSDVYTAAGALKDGDKIDLEGFVYYYDAPQLQVTSITKSTGTYAEYVAAADGTEVTISGYIQDRCTWYNNAASFYIQDNDGGYYVYNLGCSEEEYADLVPGAYITVTGAKSTWNGQAEINYGTSTDNLGWEYNSGFDSKLYAATEVADIATATLDKYKNEKVAVKNLTVTADAMYKYDGSGSEGDDIYVSFTDGTNTLTFVVESYLEDTQKASDLYKLVAALKTGDKVDLEGFVYYYNAPQLQITSCTKK